MTTNEARKFYAKCLPEKLEYHDCPEELDCHQKLFWKDTTLCNEVLDTELDCIARMVEETLTKEEQNEYYFFLPTTESLIDSDIMWGLIHLSYTQRAEALSRLERFRGFV